MASRGKFALPRSDPGLLARVRQTAPRKHEVFRWSGKTYVARLVEPRVVILPSAFMVMTYVVAGEDGSRSVAEFVHVASPDPPGPAAAAADEPEPEAGAEKAGM